jgi:hypothetical protein
LGDGDCGGAVVEAELWQRRICHGRCLSLKCNRVDS